MDGCRVGGRGGGAWLAGCIYGLVRLALSLLWSRTNAPRMAVTEEPKVSSPPTDKPAAKAEMVVVNSENTEFSAGVLGGIAGEFVARGISHTDCCRLLLIGSTIVVQRANAGLGYPCVIVCINSQCYYKWKQLLDARKLAMVRFKAQGWYYSTVYSTVFKYNYI